MAQEGPRRPPGRLKGASQERLARGGLSPAFPRAVSPTAGGTRSPPAWPHFRSTSHGTAYPP
eukprot:9163219-Pyramimonas_sp.AAC.1